MQRTTLREYLSHAPHVMPSIDMLEHDDLSFEHAKALACVVWAEIDALAASDAFDSNGHDNACGDLSIILERHTIARESGTLSDGTPWTLYEGVFDAEVSRWDVVVQDDYRRGGSAYSRLEALDTIESK